MLRYSILILYILFFVGVLIYVMTCTTKLCGVAIVLPILPWFWLFQWLEIPEGMPGFYFFLFLNGYLCYLAGVGLENIVRRFRKRT